MLGHRQVILYLLMVSVAHAADALPHPEIPDPFGLGERLALVDYLKTELHANVEPGATYDDLVKQYWEIVDKPKREAEATRSEEAQRLRSRLATEFGIKADESVDLGKLKEMLVEAERKATVRGGGEKNDSPMKDGKKPEDQAGGKGDAAVVMPLTIPGGTDVDVATPKDWQVTKIQPDAALPPTLKIHAPGGDVSLQITLLPDKESRLDTQAKIDQAVKNMGAQYADGSVEKTITVQKLTVSNGIGSYAEFTDGDLVGKKVRPGQYKVVAAGVVTIGKTAAAFTLLGDSFDQAGYLAAKKILTGGIVAHAAPAK